MPISQLPIIKSEFIFRQTDVIQRNYNKLTWRTAEWHEQYLLECDDPQSPMLSNGDPCGNDGVALPQATDPHLQYNAPIWPPHNLEALTASKHLCQNFEPFTSVTLSIVRYIKKLKTRRFGDRIGFRPQAKECKKHVIRWDRQAKLFRTQTW